eukprot:gene18689-21268_t
MDSISETFVCIGEEGRFCEEDNVKEEKPTVSSDCTENDSTIANTSQPKSKTVRFCTPQDAVGQGYSAEITAIDVNAPKSEVWVARYIHYTSKYGLGFLFNTGSAGVYFNDSTKIVLSADGKVFQYTEKHPRDSSKECKVVHQKHLIGAYPIELLKKVSLLLQFRYYLVDQQRKNEGTDFSQRDFPLVQQSSKNLATKGACASVKFGQSSTRFNSFLHTVAQKRDGENAKDENMVYLHKWVRTKQAFFFCLSNRKIQVVFHDRSEVILCEDGGKFTYVNKLGQPSVQTMDDERVERIYL